MELKDWSRSLSFVALETLPECLIDANDIPTVKSCWRTYRLEEAMGYIVFHDKENF